MALSKNYTCKIIGDVIRNIAEEYHENRLQPQDIIDIVNLAILKVYADIPKLLYQQPQAITVSNGYVDLSSLTVENIVKITDTNNGKWIPFGIDEIENLAENTRKQGNVYYSHEGTRIFVYKGTDTAAYGTITMLYEREIILCTKESDKIDVPDKFAPAVMELAKAIVYEKLKTFIPKDK